MAEAILGVCHLLDVRSPIMGAGTETPMWEVLESVPAPWRRAWPGHRRGACPHSLWQEDGVCTDALFLAPGQGEGARRCWGTCGGSQAGPLSSVAGVRALSLLGQ